MSLHNKYSQDRFLIFLAVYFSKKMDLEQTVKDLQAQNAQFQQVLLNLAKGQEDLKALFTKGSKKKTKKKVVILNIGRRFKGPA